MEATKSRTETIFSAIKETVDEKTRELIIHIVGAEENDFAGIVSLHGQYLVLFDRLSVFEFQSLKIVFIGSSISSSYDGWQTCFDVNEMNIVITIVSSLYHDWSLANSAPYPHMMFLFNAGIWGYDDWIPTLEIIKELEGCIVIITSYTFEEAEDDNDVITSHFKDSIEWLWEERCNPYRSNIRLTRTTCAVDRQYFDNFAWQCFKVLPL